jgi:hypothetical protein
MPEFQAPNLKTFWGYDVGEDGWGPSMNANLLVFDSLIQGAALSATTTVPPGGPSLGNIYIVPEDATGTWTNHDGEIAVWITYPTHGWRYLSPREGWRFWVIDVLRFYRFSSGVWIAESAGTPGGGITGFTSVAVMNGSLNFNAGTIGAVFDASDPEHSYPRLAYMKVGASGSGSWVPGTDFVAELETRIDNLLPDSGIFLEGGSPNTIYEELDGGDKILRQIDQETGQHWLPAGLAVGYQKEVSLEIVSDDTYILSYQNGNDGVLLGFRRDGNLELAGIIVEASSDPNWIVQFLSKNDQILEGSIRSDGTLFGGDGGGGLTPDQIAQILALIDQMEALIEFDWDMQNVDEALGTDSGPLNTYRRQIRLWQEEVNVMIDDFQAQYAALSGTFTGYTDEGDYTTATNYTPNSLVRGPDGTIYRTLATFTSSTIVDDLDDGNMVVMQGFTSADFDGHTTMAGKAAFRAYQGPMRTLWLHLDDMILRYYRNDADTTSDDDNGGILVDALDRRWYLSITSYLAQNRCFEIFGGDPTGVTAFDTARDHCAAWARAHNVPMRQNSGVFLSGATSGQIYTDCFFRGMEVVVNDASGMAPIVHPSEGGPGWPEQIGAVPQWDDPTSPFIIKGKPQITFDAAQLIELNTYASYMKRGSFRLPMPFLENHRGARLKVRSSTVWLHRNGENDEPRSSVFWQGQTVIGRKGAIDYPFEEDIPNGTVAEAVITQRENARLRFESPKFTFSSARVICPVRIQRNSVDLSGMVISHTDTAGFVEARCQIRLEDVFDVNLDDLSLEGNPGSSGYGIMMLGAIGVRFSNLRGAYGWGITGNKLARDIVFRDCYVNRWDAHEMGYDWSAYNCTFRVIGCRVHGGGTHYFENCKWHITPDNGISDMPGTTGDFQDTAFFLGRGDYGNYFRGKVVVRGMRAIIDKAIGWTEATGPDNLINTTTLGVVRLGYPNAGPVAADLYWSEAIDILDWVWEFDGVPLIPDRIRFTGIHIVKFNETGNPGYKVYLPNFLRVSGMRAKGVPVGSNCMISPFIGPQPPTQGTAEVNLFASVLPRRYDGTNVDGIFEDCISVVNKPYIPDRACTVYYPGTPTAWASSDYRNAVNRWVPKFVVRNCFPTLIGMFGEGKLEVYGGSIARIETGTAPFYTDETTPSVQVDVVGSEVQLVPKTTGGQLALANPTNITFTASRFKNHYGGRTDAITGTLRGAANIKYAAAAAWLNVPSGFFI